MINYADLSLELITEFQLSQETKEQIAILLHVAFPEEDFHGRHYFKQLPHSRFLLKDHTQLVGQIGLDFRVMTLNKQPINVLGLIDFAIVPALHHQGLGTFLLKSLIEQVSVLSDNIDFLLLSTDKPDFYEKFGFRLTSQYVKWLVTEEHVNYGMKEEHVGHCLMYKPLANKEWVENSVLEMMGYWY
ncbi:GNAT family N-acetyltransferase [Acinetobacter boissieri]|uniref:Acetyltransferase (GNAT) domain-containing protein n=1 Tax=Acinetobacter boissieri TaxID=1219383 RepID=A0A1G6H2F7_9GAMM|nr:GNAT family N-acetyltransferase [Acinetobacter boissieri]SDB88469.1 Acetyltransferase (GNAT) domain-containing protein [Acinetobacter boissieri]